MVKSVHRDGYTSQCKNESVVSSRIKMTPLTYITSEVTTNTFSGQLKLCCSSTRYIKNIYCAPLGYYRPQRSCGKVMFSQASVILSTRGQGVRVADTLWADTPQADTPSRHPQADTPPADTPLPPTGMHSCSEVFYMSVNLHTQHVQHQHLMLQKCMRFCSRIWWLT